MTALYPHDCDGCVFLETWQGMDWWFCPGQQFGGDIIGRCSAEPSDYCSSALELLLRPSSVKFHEDNGGARPNCKSSYILPAYRRNKEKIACLAANHSRRS